MGSDTAITGIAAREIYALRGQLGLETTVTTANGAKGTAVVQAGVSVGENEVPFVYDGGPRFGGRGLKKAVESVEKQIGPAIEGMNATNQLKVDEAIARLDPDHIKIGGNAMASVSAAVLKAGAAALGIPLYQHIGGVHACVLPTPAVLILMGSERYGGTPQAGGKPSYSLVCFGFDTFSEASYAAWEIQGEYFQRLGKKYDISGLHDSYFSMCPPPGKAQHDSEFWDLMVDTINDLGYEGRVGIQVDVAATCFFDRRSQCYKGLFSFGAKSRDDLFRLYSDAVKNYPFVIIEDPLEENDYEGHAFLTKELGIEIVGDDLFTTNTERLKKGIGVGAANTVLLKVNQIGTISQAFDMVKLAYHNGYGIMPCDSRGEGADIADYAVGLSTGHIREGALGPVGNRLLQIEAELGNRAQFWGRRGLKL